MQYRLLTFALAWPTLALSQQSIVGEIADRCASRDTATAWIRMAAEWGNERPGTWTNDSLRNVLIALADADQAERPTQGLSDSLGRPGFAIRMARRDSASVTAMREIIQRFGWPTRTLVGARGASAALQIARNNPAMQEEALRLMRALPPDEVPQSELAMLEDRFRISRNEPQRYATLLKPDPVGLAEFYPVDSVSRIGERRAAAGLPPMSVYLCMIRASTGRTAKFPPPEYSIAAPVGKFQSYWLPHARAHAGVPQTASVAVGGMYVMWRALDHSKWSGFLFLAEPGVRAGKVRVGYGSSNSSAVGISGTASLLRYWGDEGKGWSMPARNYAGYEIHLSGRYLDVGVGQYQSLAYGRLRFALSVGLGL